MENTNALIKELISKIETLDSNMKKEFASVNKRLDGIDYELKKLNTVTKYKESYNNIPA